MTDRRVFLDPKQPSLPQVARYLIERYRQEGEVRADRALVVVPGARAGRHLLDLILELATAGNLAYWPPSVTSVGVLPEQLYVPRRALAAPATQQLTWCRAIQTADIDTLSQIIPPVGDGTPTEAVATWSHERWLHLGELFYTYYRHLAADGYSFADVAQITADDETMSDSERWQAMGVIQESYLRMLDSFELWDMQTARLVAVRHRECQTDRDVILVGTVDLPRTMRAMLDQIRDQVTPLVYAPVSWSDRFDEYGTLIPEMWQTTQLPIAEKRIHVVEGPAEQSSIACELLASYEGRYRADQVVIGVPDERLISYLQRNLADHAVHARWGPGIPVKQSGPWRLLSAIADLLHEPTTSAWGALLRHPDLHEWLTKAGVTSALLREFDIYCQQRVPALLDGSWPADRPDQLVAAHQLVDQQLHTFRVSDRPLRDWCSIISNVLLSVYGDRDFNLQQYDDRIAWDACQFLQEQMSELQKLPVQLDEPVSCRDALRWVLRNSGSGMIGATPDPAAIELLGWLELLHDDAAAMIVTTFNEGYIPTSVRTDPFLPNALRTRLGMDDNARRYARDTYTLQMLLSSRTEFDLIVARRAPDDEPLLPSRILFATNDLQLPHRALRLLHASESGKSSTSQRSSGRRLERTGFDIPRPEPLRETISQLSATSIRQYLACPYRFYLSQVLRLRSSSDLVYEIDASQFGILLHQVMDSFAKSRQANSKQAGSISKTLDRLLDKHAAEMFGQSPLPTARVQIAQLRRRLRAFAEVQAKRANSGWRIKQVEVDTSEEEVVIEVDGQPMQLIGRIDRIDEHADGRLAILDYKSSESGKSPDQTHRRKGEWIDLQLPIYRHLAMGLKLGTRFELGFVVVSSDVDRVEFKMAGWGDAELASADRKLEEVIRNIRRQHFWPPAELPDNYVDEFAAICMTGVQEQPELDAWKHPL